MKKSFSMLTNFSAFAFIIILFASCKKNSDTTLPPPPPVLPAINSFSPVTGSAGTTVTISGKNFSPTGANNVVSFNGTAATVTSATADQIIVTVPKDATTGNKIVFVGNGNLVDVYDANTNTWGITNRTLSFGTTVNFQIAATANKVLFTSNNTNTGTEIYDVSTNSWSFMQEGISEQRHQMTAVVTGIKILFAGGLILPGTPPILSKTVDIYDVVTNSWSTAHLSEARWILAAAAAGNKILFAGGLNGGGVPSKTVDIYDVSNNTWSTSQLSETRFGLAAAAAGNKIVFAGGTNNNDQPSKTVDI